MPIIRNQETAKRKTSDKNKTIIVVSENQEFCINLKFVHDVFVSSRVYQQQTKC